MNEQVRYYQERAKEYELVNDKPERQEDLKKIRHYLGGEFKNMSILEIAKQKTYSNQNISYESIDYKEIKGQRGVSRGCFAE